MLVSEEERRSGGDDERKYGGVLAVVECLHLQALDHATVTTLALEARGGLYHTTGIRYRPHKRKS